MLGGVGADPFPHLERWLDALRQRLPSVVRRLPGNGPYPTVGEMVNFSDVDPKAA